MPATATTFTSLVLDLKNYPGRGSSTDTRYNDQIPRLIQKAIERLGREAKTLIDRVPIQDAMLLGNPVLAKPAYWRNTVSMMMAKGVGYGTIQPLTLKTKEFMQTYWENPASLSVPKFYGDYDQDHWLIAPTPAAAYPVEYVVDLKASPLDAANQTNFWTEKAPDLLVDACLLEAAMFLNADSPGKIQTRQAAYDRALASITGEKVTQQTDRTQRSDT